MTNDQYGYLWWIADNQAELDSWSHLEIDKTERDPDSERIHVIIRVELARAAEILGYEPEPEEWLEDWEAIRQP